MRIIALDLASTTGFAYGGHTGMTDYSGALNLRLEQKSEKDKGKFTGKSFRNFYLWLDDVIQSELLVYPGEPITIVYERPSLRPMWHTQRIAHGLAGMVEMLEGKYAHKGVVCTNVPPKGIKKFFTGAGNADKELMLVTAREIYPDCVDDNEADAIALFHYWQAVYNGEDVT